MVGVILPVDDTGAESECVVGDMMQHIVWSIARLTWNTKALDLLVHSYFEAYLGKGVGLKAFQLANGIFEALGVRLESGILDLVWTRKTNYL